MRHRVVMLARDGSALLRVLLAAPHVEYPRAVVAMPCGTVAVANWAQGKGVTLCSTRAGWVRRVDAAALGVGVGFVTGVAVDAHRRLCVCDRGNHCVLVCP